MTTILITVKLFVHTEILLLLIFFLVMSGILFLKEAKQYNRKKITGINKTIVAGGVTLIFLQFVKYNEKDIFSIKEIERIVLFSLLILTLKIFYKEDDDHNTTGINNN